MRKVMQRGLVALFVGGTLGFVGALGVASDRSDTVTVAAPVPGSPVGETCHEEDACWNSCTMQVTERCDLGAVLPHGAEFRLTVRPLDGVAGCEEPDADRYGVVATVAVVSTVGATLADATVTGCVAVGAAPVSGAVGEALPRLYRVAAQGL